MILSWWRRRRRRKWLAQPFPVEWEPVLEQNVAHYHWLDNDERIKLKQCVQIFIAEKYWEGCNGLTLSDEIKVTIAGQACLLLLGFEEEFFDAVQTILVYPDKYLARQTFHQPGGVVSESMSPRLGEAWFRGPVILSWAAILFGGQLPDDGENVVIHEFAHVLDMQDQVFDGTPKLSNPQQYKIWHEVMTGEYNQHIRRSAENRTTLLDSYAATNEAEFFAVSTECFFERPQQMADEHSEMYALLKKYYRQDPARRFRNESPAQNQRRAL